MKVKEKPTNFLKHTSKNPIQRRLIDNFNKELLKFAKECNPVRILDAGCGEGFILELLRKAQIGKENTGIEYAKESVKIGRALHPEVKIISGDIFQMPFRNKGFDLVICSEVLEHLDHPEEAIREICRVAKSRILISVPDEPWFTLTNLFRGKYWKTGGNHPEHINRWSFGQLCNLVEKNGLKIIRTSRPYPWTMVLGEK